MSILPVVQRELAVIARRPATFRSRLIAVILAVATGSSVLLLTAAGDSATPGRSLLAVFAPLLLFYSLVEGVRSTADCLSEEKRAGTLGLLFLTDLTGVDVVLGKLVATSLRLAFNLLGALPVAAMALPLGGVSGAEFIRTAVSLGAALWAALTCGLAVSAISRDESRALWGALTALGLWCVGPMVAAAVTAIVPTVDTTWIAALSPAMACWRASDFAWVAAPCDFLISLAASSLGGLALTGFAAWAAPRYWQDQTQRPPHRGRPNIVSRGLDGAQLSASPGAWLARRYWQGGGPFRLTLAVILTGAVVIVAAVADQRMAILMFAPVIALLPLKLALTLGTCQFFVRLREEGMRDALRVVPGNGADWADQFAAGTRRAWRPATLVVAAGMGLTSILAALEEPIGSSGGLVLVLYMLVTEAFDFVALYWTGAWLALRLGRANNAAFRALLWVHVVPSLVCCGLRFVVDLVVVVTAIQRLASEWRPVEGAAPGRPAESKGMLNLPPAPPTSIPGSPPITGS